MIAHNDWMPTLVAAGGESNVKEKLLKGYQANSKTFKVHLDGYNYLPFSREMCRRRRVKNSFISTRAVT